MSLVDRVYHFFPKWLSNFVYPLLHGLDLCPALVIGYYHKGLCTGSLPPSPDSTCYPSRRSILLPSLYNNLHCPNSLIF